MQADSLLNNDESLLSRNNPDSFAGSLVESLMDESNNQIDPSDETPTLLGADDNMTFAEINNDALTESQIAERKKFFLNPKNQAEILLQNYVRSQPILVNHRQRKAIYAQYLRDAKKGKYNRLFHDTIYGISKDESAEKLAKLNA